MDMNLEMLILRLHTRIKKIEFVGIAKSNCNLTRSCQAAREMLQQILVK